MKTVRFFWLLLKYDLDKLRRQMFLLAGLSLFCVLLAWRVGAAAETVLHNGVAFQGLTIAITAPEGDPTGETLALWLGKMQDVKRYGTFCSMEAEEAEEALRQGTISAILELPADFVGGVLAGDNPDITLMVSAERPLEALLTSWVGGSAADLLATFQSGIYAVLEEYDQNPLPGLSRDDVVLGVNLRYINWALGRERCFRTETVSATESLPLALHYRVSLSAYFLLAISPALSALYTAQTLRARNRLRCVGVGAGVCFAASCAARMVVFFPMALLFLWAQKLPLLLVLPAALLWAALASLLGGVLCLLLRDGAARGMVSFLLAFFLLVLAGGVLPPTMLPSLLRTSGNWTPVGLMRNVAAIGDAVAYAALLGWGMLFALVGFLLYRKQLQRGQ